MVQVGLLRRRKGKKEERKIFEYHAVLKEM